MIEVQNAIQAATATAYAAAEQFLDEHIDQPEYGTSFVQVYDLDDTGPLAQELVKHGFSKVVDGNYYWNMDFVPPQNLEALEAAADAAAALLTERLGVEFISDIRLE